MNTSRVRCMDDRLERLGEVARRERGALVAIARREGLTPEEALEVVQDALCALLGPGAPDDANPLPTLKARVRNAARNARRRHHRARPHDGIDPSDEPSGSGPDAETLLDRAEALVRLRVCVAALCELQRAVVRLRLLDERTGEDVAASLGLSRAHVDVLLYRARAALRTCMREASAEV